MFLEQVVEGCFGLVHRYFNIRWQNSPGTSEAASLDAASVPEKEIQCTHRNALRGGLRAGFADDQIRGEHFVD